MLEEGIKTERETDERREIMRRAGVDGDKKKSGGRSEADWKEP